MKQKTTTSLSWENFFKVLLIGFIFLWNTFRSEAQEKVIFPASDNLSVTADSYIGNPSDTYILLFHEEESSRGEYRDIAPRLVKMNYNCLAVDLRKGKENNYVANETSRRAHSLQLRISKLDCLKDIQGAIHYAVQKSGKPVILFGSSFSASLCLLIAKNNPDVKAVVAFSPGEFFRPQVSMQDSLKGFDKLTLIAGSKSEYPYLIELAQNIPAEKVTIFVPTRTEGEHGVKALLKSDPASNDYWLSLLMFFRNVKKLP